LLETTGACRGMLYFNILVQNVMATIFVLISGVFVGSSRHSPSVQRVWPGCAVPPGSRGGGYSKAALKVLPYGVFEIPALLIAASYGLWLGVTALRRMRGRKARRWSQHRTCLPAYFAVVFPLLIVAGGG